MAWAPDPRLRSDDYARPAQYGKPTGPRAAAAFVRTTEGSAGVPTFPPLVLPKELEDAD